METIQVPQSCPFRGTEYLTVLTQPLTAYLPHIVLISIPGHRYPPDAVQNEVIDGSEAIFTMYLEISLREDIETAEAWSQDAESILVFVSSPQGSPNALL